jgi:hypothetical protein
MEQVVFIGLGDVRNLDESDFAKMGIEHRAVTFYKNVPAEVSNETGKALLGHPLVAGEFIAFQEMGEIPEVTQVASYQGDSTPPVNLNGEDEDDDDDEGESKGAAKGPKAKAKARS